LPRAGERQCGSKAVAYTEGHAAKRQCTALASPGVQSESDTDTCDSTTLADAADKTDSSSGKNPCGRIAIWELLLS
jgi:hypothetical protein